MKINRYTLKPNITESDLLSRGFNKGGSWIYDGCEIYRFIPLNDSIELNIGFDGSKEWNDIDNILVLDDDFGQPYTPFYRYYDEDINDYEFLENVVKRYNEVMDNLDFLERV